MSAGRCAALVCAARGCRTRRGFGTRAREFDVDAGRHRDCNDRYSMTEKKRTIRLISNPNAGRGGRRRAAEVARFCELLGARGIEVETLTTNAPGDATRLAAEAAHDGVREVIVSGGDGTINEALQGLVGGRVRLGIWPAGTANVLARELRLPFDAVGAADVIARGRTRRIYAGCATEEVSGARRYFFLMAGIGLDASVVERVRPRLKRRVGEGAFWVSGLGHLVSWQPIVFSVEVGGRIYPATFAAFGRAAHYGGDISVTPGARLDEPEFEICIVNSHSRLRFLQLLAHGLRRNGVRREMPGVRYVRATRARATGEARMQIDGELTGRLPVTFGIEPVPVEVIAPPQEARDGWRGYQRLR
ncbi:MAG: diacylglycerol kinase family lipid kinase [Acidobacteria bacterium]|nr:diacylglycerol kinase family lipid kinase [Acidobacteriota bacterium]